MQGSRSLAPKYSVKREKNDRRTSGYEDKNVNVALCPLEGGEGELMILKFNKTRSGIRTVKTRQPGLTNRYSSFIKEVSTKPT
jgi:hypothetical protein